MLTSYPWSCTDRLETKIENFGLKAHDQNCAINIFMVHCVIIRYAWSIKSETKCILWTVKPARLNKMRWSVKLEINSMQISKMSTESKQKINSNAKWKKVRHEAAGEVGVLWKLQWDQWDREDNSKEQTKTEVVCVGLQNYFAQAKWKEKRWRVKRC